MVAAALRLLALILLTAPPAAAQIPETTAAWRYFPLGLGDVWEYEVCSCSGGFCEPEPWCRYLRKRIVGFTTLYGRVYAVRHEQQYTLEGQPDGNPRVEHLRFDTLAAKPMRNDGTFEDRRLVPCRLDEPFPENPEQGHPLECHENASGEMMYGGPDEPFTVGPGSYTGALKSFSYFAGLYYGSSFVADLGMISYYEVKYGEHYETLKYARVGGVEHGAGPVAAGPERSPVEFDVHPNPSRGAATATYALAEPARVRLAVYDVLGRAVAVLVDEWKPAGSHRATFDGSALPAGVYVARLEAGSFAAARRLLVLR